MTAADVLEKQKKYFETGATKDVDFRISQLSILYDAISANEKNIYKALKKDLNKSHQEALMTEIGIVKSEIKGMIRKVGKWQKTKHKRTPLSHFPALSYAMREPFGSILIISPWNYPFQLAMMPLIGAIAGGNCAFVKPSRKSANTLAVIGKIIKEAFDSRYVAFAGEEYDHDSLLDMKFDMIFFTGSAKTGEHVLKKAAENMIPTVLELGGKSPCIVDKSANLEIAARRIAWGKCVNAGQTCIAPDYVLADAEIMPTLAVKLRKYMDAMYENPLCNKNYVHIINRENYERLKGYIRESTAVTGGRFDDESLCIEPALIFDASEEQKVMQDEIFGPVLPLIPYDNLQEAVAMIKKKPKPLALYMFSQDKRMIKAVCADISFGGGCINDTLMHCANPHIPFGGVGSSGMGSYHGRYSFETFTRVKGIQVSRNFEIPLKYPPYGEVKTGLLNWIFKADKQ